MENRGKEHYESQSNRETIDGMNAVEKTSTANQENKRDLNTSNSDTGRFNAVNTNNNQNQEDHYFTSSDNLSVSPDDFDKDYENGRDEGRDVGTPGL